ncbi:MAG TPA: septation protein SepH, partial [Acidimicrobiales bacterium]
MRKLHLVGYTPDLEGLIFTARRGSKSGGYVVAIEDALVDTIDEARRRRNGDTPSGAGTPSSAAENSGTRSKRRESTLTPREIQARLRSGRSIAQVAAEARVDPDWVERFAVPILAEQAQIVELARGLTYSKPRLGPSTQPLGASVAWNLADRGVQIPDDVLAAAWTAYQVHDTLWRVRLVYRSRSRAKEAIWELDVQTGQLVARNRLAAELAHVEKGRRRRVVSRLRSGPHSEPEPQDEATVPK